MEIGICAGIVLEVFVFSSYVLRLCYTCMMFCLACIYFPWRLLSAPKYRHRLIERFGFINVPKKYHGAIWIHAVSVGETMAAIPLIKRLQIDYPNVPMILSNTTITGAERSAHLYPELPRIFFPWDFKHAVRRTLSHLRPRLLILLETELWPNLIEACSNSGVPVLLLNGRMSARSARGYGRFQPLSAEIFGQLSAIAAQTASSARRFRALGAPSSKISVCGNLKFDTGISEERRARARALREHYNNRMLWVAGSTHAGEEKIVLAAASLLWKTFPELLLVLAPRHPERFGEVDALCRAQTDGVLRYSAREMGQQSCKVLVLDEMGRLEDFLAAADVAFIGGSLVPVGGHNMFEAAAYGVPVLCGPHLFNFEDAAMLLRNCGALVLVRHAQALARKIAYWLDNESARKSVGLTAADVAASQRGALDKHMATIASFL